ncbi:GAF domain-containing protein [Reinekea blandensis]|uniref:Putative diguanylate cyclase (GGDEF domain) with GAF sensor domain n=1 Tax=Reinekea blandensis MED297 TaxID=314283 RepID=A4BK94_9GAMM|nr:GAF domain-containing protein [Reinekea blandensis]EAR07461.1 Putative diguanylate cyclase (GGDEF domain) with GAF sensor domain [Reinekea sp. MED297] [Reinekea blandensis MED297]
MKAPLPAVNEQQRLSALQRLNILDTPPEERFDRITRLARATFHVPIALVSLVDENRQWFKSCFGLDVRHTDRNISFCGHAIHSDALLVIENTLIDSRFHDNPLVIGNPHIRFYAGAPLHAPEGERIGTLCLIDRKPRQLDHSERKQLRQLADIVEQELVSVRSSSMDSETELSNRKGLLDLADYCLLRASQQELPLTLAVMTVERTNETTPLSHDALVYIAGALKQRLRETDVLARTGPNQFTILMVNCEDDEAEAILGAYIDIIQSEVTKLGFVENLRIQLTTEALNPANQSAKQRLEDL